MRTFFVLALGLSLGLGTAISQAQGTTARSEEYVALKRQIDRSDELIKIYLGSGCKGDACQQITMRVLDLRQGHSRAEITLMVDKPAQMSGEAERLEKLNQQVEEVIYQNELVKPKCQIDPFYLGLGILSVLLISFSGMVAFGMPN